MSRHIAPLTAMRGLAALWVMAFHIDVSLVYRDMGALLPRDETGLLSKGYLWVDFFFILSGFVIAHVHAGSLKVGDYLRARLARIYPLHLFCLGLVMLIALIYPLFLPEITEDGSWKIFMAWSAIPSNLLLTHAMDQHVYLSWDIVSWSIGAEFWTYIAAIPLLVSLPKLSRPASFAVGAAAYALLALFVLSQPEPSLDITYKWGFTRCLAEFVIGACLRRCWRDGNASWLGRNAALLGILAALAMIFHFKANDLLVIPLHCLLIYGLCENRGLLTGRVAQYLGKISYSLYLNHGVVFSAAWFLMPAARAAWGVPSPAAKWLYAALFAALTVALSHLTCRAVERPMRDLVRFQKLRVTASSARSRSN